MALVKILGLASVAVTMVAIGCGPKTEMVDSSTPTASVPKTMKKPNADAGVPITQSTDAKLFPALVAQSDPKFGRGRPDPFSLTPAERDFDMQQGMERLLNQASGFSIQFQPKEDVIERPEIEPQPYRRLSGVVVGDSVLAILDMGDGQPVIIRPGQRVPNSPWTVVSIDEDKAVLRRSGNTLPHEVTVRLESPPAGVGLASGPATGAGAPPGFGGPGGFSGGPRGGAGGGGKGE